MIEGGKGGRLADLINGLHADDPQKRFVRALDNKVRAWLSNSYRVIENHDVAYTCLDEARKKNANVLEASLTDKRMRIKFTTQEVWDKIDIRNGAARKAVGSVALSDNRELIGKTILGATIRDELPGGSGTIHPVVTVLNSRDRPRRVSRSARNS